MLKKQLLKLALILWATTLYGQTVSPSGAFVYNYPIKVPPGTGGLTPSVALSYNSQGGSGTLGKGFNLTGFETISRDSSYPVNFSGYDHFLLNGQRLIPKGRSGTDFYLENHDFSRIERIGNYWIVTDKRGTKKYYGSSSGNISVFSSNGDERAGRTRIWALDRVEDVHGNFYEIHYVTNKGAYYPEKIIYNQNRYGNLPHKTLYFNYQKKTHSYTTYNPSEITDEYVLKWVSITASETLLGKYEMNYSIADLVTQLTSITEYGNKGFYPLTWNDIFIPGSESKKKPTLFTWTSSPVGFKTVKVSNIQDFSSVEDINSDGLTDLLVPHDVTNLSAPNEKNQFKTYTFNNINSFVYKGLFPEKPDDPFKVEEDFDGDGRTDSLSFNNNQWETTLNKASGTVRINAKLPFGSSKVFFGDVNGDGFSDVLRGVQNSYGRGYCYIYLSDGTGRFLSGFPVINVHSDEVPFLRIQDINGDGKGDLVTWKKGSRTIKYIYYDKYNPDGTQIIGTNTTYHPFLFKYRLSKGNNFASESTGGGKLGYFNNVTGDFNGDGYPDILRKGNGEASHDGYRDEDWYMDINRFQKLQIQTISTPTGMIFTPEYTLSTKHEGAIKPETIEYNEPRN